MLKEHIHDLFYEGLGDIFFVKYYQFLNKNIKNVVVKKILIGIHKIVYLLFLIGVAYIIFKLSFPI